MRNPFIPVLFSIAVLGLLMGPAPARADQRSEREQAEEMARDAIERFMRALELMIDSIPQYEMPEINEDGDIIIRRKRREEPEEPHAPEVDQTET